MAECLIGIDMNTTNVRIARIKDNKVKKYLTEKIKAKDNKEALINQIGSLIERVITPEVSGIGMGVPSVVDTEKGIVYDVQNIPSWEKVHLKSIYEEKFELPVFINNDANCCALGEKYSGRVEDYDSIAVVTIGSGMGAGIIMNGMLFEGPHCGIGEVGMLPYRESVIEHYCSEIFFNRRENITGKEALRLASEGNIQIKALFDEFGVHMGMAIEAVIFSYDPEIIILGGVLSKGFKYFKNNMHHSLESFAFQRSLSDLEITVTEDDYVGLKGAAALVLENKSNG